MHTFLGFFFSPKITAGVPGIIYEFWMQNKEKEEENKEEQKDIC
jgi:hypothetical protein